MVNTAITGLINKDSHNYIVSILISFLSRSRLLRVNIFSLLIASIFLISCSTTQPPVPVVDRGKTDMADSAKTLVSGNAASQFYIVQKGDTLYGIALKQGIDFKKLVEWNNIVDPRSIRPGQKIILSEPKKDSQLADSQPALFALPQQPIAATLESVASPIPADVAPLPGNSTNIADTGKVKTSPKALKLPFSEQNAAPSQYPPVDNTTYSVASSLPAPAATGGGAKIEAAPQQASQINSAANQSVAGWIWPTAGKLLSSFSKNSKGVKISGQAGQPVLASAAGEVVYSGHGLRGYGNLIIIKHDNTYLSAYAHNSKLLVKEGEAVAKGQKIAEMGNTDTDTIQLHFEIRKNGKPVDPLEYLPNPS